MRMVAAIVVLAAIASAAKAQHGTAPNGYYPSNYHGDTFTGEVTAASGDEITLTFMKGKKTQAFVGRLEMPCNVPKADKSPQRLGATDIPKGTVLVAFYNTQTKKIGDKKIEENMVFAIAFDVWQGKKVPDDKKLVFSCSTQTFATFQVH